MRSKDKFLRDFANERMLSVTWSAFMSMIAWQYQLSSRTVRIDLCECDFWIYHMDKKYASFSFKFKSFLVCARRENTIQQQCTRSDMYFWLCNVSPGTPCCFKALWGEICDSIQVAISFHLPALSQKSLPHFFIVLHWSPSEIISMFLGVSFNMLFSRISNKNSG